ncbi:anti-sigma factor [Homoserinibacter sp. YIM 151385]|uniref:anti-sigma factor n=1 Tax=Homoserinibacter sp. YIM 151385 TaxID=2985506 RepID=UPI0022F097D5|nr:anti-sigma factor [Homoserinibacter sp. YIM 151385]WBU39320.1 anti-sigma factor [Homoserinibacter sp. YIM 151385]
MTDRFPEDIGTWSGAYALGALDAAETALFEQYLLEAEQAREESTGFADTAVELGLAVRAEAPPASLKAGIMGMLDAVPQLPAQDAVVEPAAPVAAPESAPELVAAAPAPSRAETRARARWFQRPVGALAAVAAAAALIAGGGITVNLLSGQSAEQQLTAQVEQIRQAPDAQETTTEIERGGTVTTVWSGELGRSAVEVEGLGQLSEAQLYELWYIDEQGATPAGTFSMPADGIQRVVLDGRMDAGDTIGITVEDAPGATTPSDDLVVAVATA